MSSQSEGVDGAEQFAKVKRYLAELGYAVVSEDPDQQLVVISDEASGIANMILDCEDHVLIIEQVVFEIKGGNPEFFKRLLQMNRNFVHGAFVLDEAGRKVIYHDTLELEHLDLNEIDASINSLSLFLAEHSGEIIEMAKAV